MAKGNWLLGGVSGKVGDLVLSKMNGKQVTRARNRSPKNPKTSAQALQRMKFGALAAFYSAFETEILNHSWQGVKYGGPSHNFFYKNALSSSVKIPAVAKGARTFVPSNYPMSRGSLDSVQVSFDGVGYMVTDIAFNWPKSGGIYTFGEFIDAFVAAQPYYAGKQLTFVLISVQDDNFIPSVTRIILDKAAYTEDVLNKEYNNLLVFDDLVLDFTEYDTVAANQYGVKNVAAGCVIVSEWTGTIWARSNSDLVINDNVVSSSYYQGDYFSAALKTYMDSSTMSTEFSDKYLNGAGSVPVNDVIPTSYYEYQSTSLNVTINETVYDKATFTCMGLYMSDGSWRLPSTDGTIAGKPIVLEGKLGYLQVVKGDTVSYLNDVTWNDLQTAKMIGVNDVTSVLITYKNEYSNLPKK